MEEVFLPSGLAPEAMPTKEVRRPEQFSFMLQAWLIREFLSAKKGTQDEWVDAYAERFRELFVTRRTAWEMGVRQSGKNRAQALAQIQEELEIR